MELLECALGEFAIGLRRIEMAQENPTNRALVMECLSRAHERIRSGRDFVLAWSAYPHRRKA